MKKSKSFLIWPLGLLCILFFMGSAHALPTASLELSSADIYEGDTFDLNVIVDGVTGFDPMLGPDEIIAFGFDVDYNLAQFEYRGATVWPGETLASFFDPGFHDDSALLSPDVAGSYFGLPGSGPNGDNILLASLSFTPLMTGSFSLGITSDLSDMNEGLGSWLYGPLDLTNSINIDVASAAAPVPEPGTILLFGTGLAGFVGFRKKFKK